jgi:iron(III) transport system substrate-binding protein
MLLLMKDSLARLITGGLLALGLAACGGSQASQPAGSSTSPAQYTGADRQQRLEEAAKKEGSVSVYTTNTNPKLWDAFMARYPGVKVDAYRADSTALNQRVANEEQAGKHLVDVLENEDLSPFMSFLQPYSSPETATYPKEAIQPQGYWAPTRASYVGLGFNTKLVTREQAPKNWDDLLDPQWKGKMTLAGSSTGVRMIGALLYTRGEDFVRKLAQQQIRVQNISGRALADLVVGGEVPLSPTIFNSHVADSKKKSAPIDWIPLEPTVANPGVIGIAARAPHPNAAMLFIDFALSEQGQKIYVDQGYSSSRQGLAGPEGDFKKLYLENVTPNYQESFDKWQQLLHTLFA